MTRTIPAQAYSDGKSSMPVVITDGGRADAGYKGKAGDCVCRAIATVTGKPYVEIYSRLAAGMGSQRAGKVGKQRASARNGIYVKRQWFRDYMAELGFTWTPTMQVGQGCKVHLLQGELPAGKHVVSVSKHFTAVIDGVVHDSFDPHRTTLVTEDGVTRLSHRCVYGFWTLSQPA